MPMLRFDPVKPVIIPSHPLLWKPKGRDCGPPGGNLDASICGMPGFATLEYRTAWHSESEIHARAFFGKGQGPAGARTYCLCSGRSPRVGQRFPRFPQLSPLSGDGPREDRRNRSLHVLLPPCKTIVCRSITSLHSMTYAPPRCLRCTDIWSTNPKICHFFFLLGGCPVPPDVPGRRFGFGSQ